MNREAMADGPGQNRLMVESDPIVPVEERHTQQE
jgi:hypothetical protein